MKKSFYELYLEKKTTPEQSNTNYQDIPHIRSPSRFLLRLQYYIGQILKLIIKIVFLILSAIGLFSITNPYIRNEIIWLLFK